MIISNVMRMLQLASWEKKLLAHAERPIWQEAPTPLGLQTILATISDWDAKARNYAQI